MNSLPIVGEHPALMHVLELARKAAQADSTVLITGETGTGKKAIARYIHNQSTRLTRPFVVLNCASMSVERAEREFFGQAPNGQQGHLLSADGGTIVLDQLGEMPLPAQARLLNLLRQGGNAAHARVIGVTCQVLEDLVRSGNFRSDLYYEIQVLPLAIPPLRDRRSDIPRLVQHFLDERNQQRSGQACTIADDAMVRLWEYDWPGNVRELEKLIERMVILSEDSIIRVENLPPNIRSFISDKKIPRLTLTEEGIDLNQAVEEFEYRLIEEALRRTKGNRQAAAQLLGLNRTTLVAKLRRRSGVANGLDV